MCSLLGNLKKKLILGMVPESMIILWEQFCINHGWADHWSTWRGSTVNHSQCAWRGDCLLSILGEQINDWHAEDQQSSPCQLLIPHSIVLCYPTVSVRTMVQLVFSRMGFIFSYNSSLVWLLLLMYILMAIFWVYCH